MAVDRVRDLAPLSHVVAEQFGAYMRAESDKWAKLIAAAKIQAQ